MLTSRQPRHRRIRAAWLYAILPVGLGLVLSYTRLGYPLAALSYDLPFFFGPQTECPDSIALLRLGSDMYNGRDEGLNRRSLAEVIRELTARRSGPVFLDLSFKSSDDAEADRGLAEAIRAHGRVVLAAELRVDPHQSKQEPVMPSDVLREAARAYGFVSLGPEGSWEVCRRVFDDSLHPNVNRVVLGLAPADHSAAGDRPYTDRWIRYYGGPGKVFAQYDAGDLLGRDEAKVPASGFQGRIVYVGADRAGVENDRWVTPFSRFNGPRTAGYEIHATVLQNLLEDSSLRALDVWTQTVLSGLIGLVVGLGLPRLRPWRATVFVLVGAISIALVSFLLQWKAGLWWSWAVPVFVLAPTGLLLSVVANQSRPILPRSQYDVFLSYRRRGGDDTARLLREQLKQRGYRVFLDVEDLGSYRFDEALLRTVRETPHFVVVLHEGALDRCGEPDDWLAKEISAAVESRRSIVPLLKDFRFPPAEELPGRVGELAKYAGVTYSHEHFAETVSRIEALLKDAELRAPPGDGG